MSLWEERAARNEALFREANERAEDLLPEGETAADFVCECSDEGCTDRLRVPLGVYEEVRSHPRHFLVLPGHQNPLDRALERRDGFVIVEKSGTAGRIADRTNPRP
jgi:hypothetical protein